MADSLIHVTGLRKAYVGHLVLDEVTLDVHAGEAVALLGANGAGKTTLLKILATLVRPSRGAAAIAGLDCVRQAEEVRRHVGLIAHGTWVYEDLEAIENLRFWAALSGLPDAPGDLGAALAAVELDRFTHERVRTFSEGMKRRLALARLLLGQPRVLLLDEPFASLDQAARKWLEDYLLAVKAGGGAILMVTHSFGRGFALADRFVILGGGRIVLDTPRGTLTPDDVQRLYDLHAEEAS